MCVLATHREPESVRAARAQQARAAATAKAKAKTDETNRIAAERRAATKAEQPATESNLASERSGEEKAPPGPLDATRAPPSVPLIAARHDYSRWCCLDSALSLAAPGSSLAAGRYSSAGGSAAAGAGGGVRPLTFSTFQVRTLSR